MTNKAKAFLSDHMGVTIVGVLLTALFVIYYGMIAAAQQDAKEAKTKVVLQQASAEAIAEDVEEIKKSAKEMSKAVTVIKELVIRHDKDLEFNRTQHEVMNKRIEKIED